MTCSGMCISSLSTCPLNMTLYLASNCSEIGKISSSDGFVFQVGA